MKIKQSLLSLTIVSAQLLCACAGSNDPATDTLDNTNITTESTESTETTSEYVDPNVDYDGAEFTILDYDTDDYFWKAATYSDIFAEEETGDPINDAQYKRNRKAEEELNITLKTYPVGGVGRGENTKELRKLILADDDTVDAAFLFAFDMKSILAEPGYLVNLNSIPTLDIYASWYDQNAIDTFTFGDNIKAVTGDISIYKSFSPILYFYNKSLADTYKINDLYDLVRDGKWTFDKVYEYCHLVASDLDGNDIMDENDSYGMAEQSSLMSDFIIASGVRYTTRNKNGEIELTLNNERMIDIVERFVPFLNDGNTNNNATNYSKQYSNPFYEMQLPMFKNNQILFNCNQLLISFELRAMDADYGLLPLPKYDETQDKYYTPMSMYWMTMLCVPATNSRLEMTGHVLDALGYYSQQLVTPEYIDTTVRYKSLRDDDSAEMLEIILDNTAYDIAQIYNWGNITTMVNNLAIKNNTNFASQYQSIESQVLAEMKKTLDQME